MWKWRREPRVTVGFATTTGRLHRFSGNTSRMTATSSMRRTESPVSASRCSNASSYMARWIRERCSRTYVSILFTASQSSGTARLEGQWIMSIEVPHVISVCWTSARRTTSVRTWRRHPIANFSVSGGSGIRNGAMVNIDTMASSPYTHF